VGCNEDIFRPAPYAAGQLPLRVLSYNTFLPLHGVDVILQAAAQVRELPLRLKIIGAGPLQGEMLQLARTLRLENVEFCPPVAPAQLADEIAQADVCLGGHFGSSDKASRVVPGKIYQMLAVGRPIVAANSPANRDLLAHGESAFLIPPGDAAALAGGLDALAHDGALRSRLAAGGRAVFERDCSEAIVTERLHRIVHQLV
jgi:glycosyltransferase involved in cell wall biosynthesis